jgi:hypothetical protein
MKLKDAVILAAKIEDEVDELADLKPGQARIVRGLVKVRMNGERWTVGVVLEKETEG